MECPYCGHKTYVTNSIDKKYFIKRYRTCSNKKCKRRFTTSERPNSDWEYKTIILKIKKLISEVE